MLDLKPLLSTLSKVSAGRVVEWAEHTVEGDLQQARIPVKFVDETDKTDSFLRRYAKDWQKAGRSQQHNNASRGREKLSRKCIRNLLQQHTSQMQFSPRELCVASMNTT